MTNMDLELSENLAEISTSRLRDVDEQASREMVGVQRRFAKAMEDLTQVRIEYIGALAKKNAIHEALMLRRTAAQAAEDLAKDEFEEVEAERFGPSLQQDLTS